MRTRGASLEESLQRFIHVAELADPALNGVTALQILTCLNKAKDAFLTLIDAFVDAETNALQESFEMYVSMRWQGMLREILLTTWAVTHWHNPYPTRLQQLSFAMFTGKSRQQVSDWFTNWRARLWSRRSDCDGLQN